LVGGFWANGIMTGAGFLVNYMTSKRFFLLQTTYLHESSEGLNSSLA